MLRLGGLHLSELESLPTPRDSGTSALAASADSWQLSESGSLRHNATGIRIGELGVKDGQMRDGLEVDPADVDVDHDSLLGRGAGGRVARGRHRPTGKDVAVKVVSVDDKAKRSQLVNDLGTLLSLPKSEHLLEFYGASYQKAQNCVHIMLEFMDMGSLEDIKQKAHVVPEMHLAITLEQVLQGLQVLHDSSIVHRDVKLSNILVNSSGAVKLADFGISKSLKSEREESLFCDTFVGTATHMSPERVLGQDYSFAADVWSLGLCTYELASGSYPYGQVSSFLTLHHNACSKPEPRLPANDFSASLCDFVARCLCREAELRASVVALQEHEFIVQSVEVSSRSKLAQWLKMLSQCSSDVCNADEVAATTSQRCFLATWNLWPKDCNKRFRGGSSQSI